MFFFLVSGMLTGCGGPSGDAATQADGAVAAPAATSTAAGQNQHQPEGFGVTASSPSPGADKQALVRKIVIEFTDPPMHETLSLDSVYLARADGRVAAHLDHSIGSNRVFLAPQTSLEPNTTYSVEVTDAVMSTDGESFAGTAWSFTTAANVGPTPQQVLDACMSESDIEMLARINNARSSPRSCGADAAPAVAPLSWNCTIEEAAQAHSDDMAGLNFFSHTGSDGSSAGDRLSVAGYKWSAWGENIAAGQTSVRQVVDELLKSPGHCLNIMNEVYTEMGAALARNAEADYQLYWTQNFALPQR